VVGNEESGIPPEIILNSDVIYVEMPGVGFCLNTAQAANIILYEAVRQYNQMTVDRTKLKLVIEN
jgi:tRNA G18 (ribose-2'-O)-methylase SpoU